VTGSEAERNLGAEQAYTDEIVEKILLMQANAVAEQQRALARGTHAKGVTARAQFEVLDVTVGRDGALAARLAKGIFATPGIYPATVRAGRRVVRGTARLRKAAGGGGRPIARYAIGATPRPVGGGSASGSDYSTMTCPYIHGWGAQM
jgi:hypothetical protein